MTTTSPKPNLPASLRMPGENCLTAIRVVAGLSDDERSTLCDCHLTGCCLVYAESKTPALKALGKFSAPPTDHRGENIRDFHYQVSVRGRAFAAIANSMAEGKVDALIERENNLAAAARGAR